MKPNITMIGMPSLGKSTIGVLLAKRLGFSFVDVDIVIQEKEGRAPVKAGGYTVNQAMKDRILKGPISPHASNMGALKIGRASCRERV